MTAAEVEQSALAREHAAFGAPDPAAGTSVDGDGEPTAYQGSHKSFDALG